MSQINKIFFTSHFLCPECETLEDKLEVFSNKHYSQHLLDDYSFTHIIWGIIYGLTLKNLKNVLLANFIFEFFENSFIIVELYKKAGYERTFDTWINIIGDTLCVLFGYLISKLGKIKAIIILVYIEIMLNILDKDSVIKMLIKIFSTIIKTFEK